MSLYAMGLGLVTALALVRPGNAEPIPRVADNFFKWGEYDSLTNVMEPWLAKRGGDGNAADAPILAKANLYLGVAYYSAGKMQAADEAFGRAYRLDHRVQPDRFYVSNSIANRYDRVAQDLERKRQGDTVSADPSAARPSTTGATGRTGTVTPGGHSAWIWWTVGGAGLAAAGTIAYLMFSSDEPKETVTTVGVP